MSFLFELMPNLNMVQRVEIIIVVQVILFTVYILYSLNLFSRS